MRPGTTAAGLGHALSADSPHHAGRNIGLCNGKLSAMSGEEVESMELSKLADHVGKVGSPRGLAGSVEGAVFPASHSRTLPFHASMCRCLSSSGPARSTNSKS